MDDASSPSAALPLAGASLPGAAERRLLVAGEGPTTLRVLLRGRPDRRRSGPPRRRGPRRRRCRGPTTRPACASSACWPRSASASRQGRAAGAPPRASAATCATRLLEAPRRRSLRPALRGGRRRARGRGWRWPVATEPLILEAVRQMRRRRGRARGARRPRPAPRGHDRPRRRAHAHADRGLPALAHRRAASARQVLQLVPLDPQETERTLLGLLLTGRVECRRRAPATTPPRSRLAAGRRSRARTRRRAGRRGIAEPPDAEPAEPGEPRGPRRPHVVGVTGTSREPEVVRADGRVAAPGRGRGPSPSRRASRAVADDERETRSPRAGRPDGPDAAPPAPRRREADGPGAARPAQASADRRRLSSAGGRSSRSSSRCRSRTTSRCSASSPAAPTPR